MYVKSIVLQNSFVKVLSKLYRNKNGKKNVFYQLIKNIYGSGKIKFN